MEKESGAQGNSGQGQKSDYHGHEKVRTMQSESSRPVEHYFAELRIGNFEAGWELCPESTILDLAFRIPKPGSNGREG